MLYIDAGMSIFSINFISLSIQNLPAFFLEAILLHNIAFLIVCDENTTFLLGKIVASLLRLWRLNVALNLFYDWLFSRSTRNVTVTEMSIREWKWNGGSNKEVLFETQIEFVMRNTTLYYLIRYSVGFTDLFQKANLNEILMRVMVIY